ASDLDSKVSSRTIALEQVKRLLLEELGTYLISETEVKNFRLTKDQVTTYSAGVVSAEVVDEKWDGKTYYLKAKVSADPAAVAKSLQNIVNDKQKSKELEDVRKKAAEFSKEIERLKKELAIVKTDTKKIDQKADAKKEEGKVYTNQDLIANRDLIKPYNEAVKGLSAMDWVEKGYALVSAGKPQEAISVLTNAIALNPKNIEAYGLRGIIYASHNDSEYLLRALDDINKVAELNPKRKGIYGIRGTVFARLGKYKQAIADINNEIGRGSNDAMFYYYRGISYTNLGYDQQALNDFKVAVKLGDKSALKILKKAAELGNRDIQNFLKSQGIGW
ncbi:MAG: tetratricopeptide repeat protein, partial [Thermodesulfovibrionales bacterium]|nr:tetratricopeptide repeat protein [Thermodesulfovibrionales bacterium]